MASTCTLYKMKRVFVNALDFHCNGCVPRYVGSLCSLRITAEIQVGGTENKRSKGQYRRLCAVGGARIPRVNLGFLTCLS